MDIPSKLSAFLSGVPLGVALAWLNMNGEANDGSGMLPSGVVVPLLILYFFISIVLFVLGYECIKKRSKYPVSKLYSEPKIFIKYHAGIMAMDILNMLVFFIGCLVGGVVLSLTQT